MSTPGPIVGPHGQGDGIEEETLPPVGIDGKGRLVFHQEDGVHEVSPGVWSDGTIVFGDHAAVRVPVKSQWWDDKA